MKIQLYIKKSQLPGAGKGLFTKSSISKGTRIAEYKGKITSWKDADHDNGNNRYIYYISKNRVIDAKGCKSSLAHFANDATGYHRIKGIKNNSSYEIIGQRVFIIAASDIPKYSELFVSYGKDYWRVLKKNKVI